MNSASSNIRLFDIVIGLLGHETSNSDHPTPTIVPPPASGGFFDLVFFSNLVFSSSCFCKGLGLCSTSAHSIGSQGNTPYSRSLSWSMAPAVPCPSNETSYMNSEMKQPHVPDVRRNPPISNSLARVRAPQQPLSGRGPASAAQTLARREISRCFFVHRLLWQSGRVPLGVC